MHLPPEAGPVIFSRCTADALPHVSPPGYGGKFNVTAVGRAIFLCSFVPLLLKPAAPSANRHHGGPHTAARRGAGARGQRGDGGSHGVAVFPQGLLKAEW